MNRISWRSPIICAMVIALIGIAAAARRALIPAFGIGASPATRVLDDGIARHPVLTLRHMIPGALFMTLGPLRFIPAIRAQRLWLRRWSGRLFVAAGYIVGLSALAMSFKMAIGGANETAATTLFAVVFLFSLTKAFWHIRHQHIRHHREWMIRAFAIGLRVATTRPIVGMFVTTRRLAPQEFFGIAFWLGFTLTAVGAEVWINLTRTQPLVIAAQGTT